MPRNRRWRAAAVASAALLAASAHAASGRVVDAAGNAVADARVCYVVGGVSETFCVRTGPDGRYVLPASGFPSIRVAAKGYFPRSAPPGDLAEPIVVAKAASIRVKLTREDGAPLSTGEVWIAFPWGEERGPFPVNAAGVEIGSLPPVPAIVIARGAGVLEAHSPKVSLAPGETREVVLTLAAEPKLAAPADGRN